MYNNTIMHTINMYSAARSYATALLLMLFYAQYRVFDRNGGTYIFYGVFTYEYYFDMIKYKIKGGFF